MVMNIKAVAAVTGLITAIAGLLGVLLSDNKADEKVRGVSIANNANSPNVLIAGNNSSPINISVSQQSPPSSVAARPTLVPPNIFSNFAPGIHSSGVTEYLGPPRRKERIGKIDAWFYELQDGYIQFDIESETVIATTVELKGNYRSRIPIAPLDKTFPDISPFLGSMSFSSLEPTCPRAQYTGAARTDIVYVNCYLGRPGDYLTYFFGASGTKVDRHQLIEYVSVLGRDYQFKSSRDLERTHCDAMSICTDYLR